MPLVIWFVTVVNDATVSSAEVESSKGYLEKSGKVKHKEYAKAENGFQTPPCNSKLKGHETEISAPVETVKPNAASLPYLTIFCNSQIL